VRAERDVRERKIWVSRKYNTDSVLGPNSMGAGFSAPGSRDHKKKDGAYWLGVCLALGQAGKKGGFLRGRGGGG